MRVLAAIVASIALLACSEQQQRAAAEQPAPMPGAPPPAALPEPAVPTPAAPTPVPQPTAAAPVAFACGDDARTAPAELQRLTMTQYRNTVRDLARWALGDATAADAALALAALDTVPIDRRAATPGDPHGGYRRLDQALDQVHVDETYRAAAALGRALAAPERLGTLVGACAGDQDAGNDEACVSDFIRRFGARALRRPLDDEDIGFYRIVYGADPTPSPAAYADLITVLLSAPELLYFVEHGADEIEGDPGNFALSAYELAARLSYHFWQTLPDDGLWQAAADGTLLEPDVLAQQIDRLLADGRARATMAELFGDWLGLEALPELDAHAQDPGYAAFASSDLPGPELRRHVIDEALDMLAHYTWTEPAGVAALFTSERSFARSADLAHIYGVEPWDGSSAPPSMPHGERAGLLTHAWFLADATASTRPIQRGVRIRRTLLCDELAPPPPGVAAMPPEPRPDQTTRQAIEALTEQPGTTCASCHALAINPLGFAFEGFDSLGRARSEQPSFGSDGTRLGVLPVDSVTVPRVTRGDESVSTGPADLVQLMLESGKLEACLARNYFRFTFGRYEDPTRDGCALERLRARLVESGRIRDMLAEAGLLAELRERRFEP